VAIYFEQDEGYGTCSMQGRDDEFKQTFLSDNLKEFISVFNQIDAQNFVSQ